MVRHLEDDALEADDANVKCTETSSIAPATWHIAYIDRRTLIRSCIGRWLASGFPAFAIDTFGSVHDIGTVDSDSSIYKMYVYYATMSQLSQSLIRDDIERLLGNDRNVPLALLADEDRPGDITEAFSLGVHGYIPTSLGASIAIEALRLVCAGGTYAPTTSLQSSAQANVRAASDEAHRFTVRETQILRCLRNGMANKLIAYELGMCEATVKVHVRNIMKKLRATNRTQIVLRTWEYLRDEVVVNNL